MSKPNLRKPRLSSEQRASFTESADYQIKPTKKPANEKRDFKAVNVGMNQYEWELLEEACKESGQTKKGFFRMAMLAKAKEVLK
jgi:hypothetical protein